MVLKLYQLIGRNGLTSKGVQDLTLLIGDDDRLFAPRSHQIQRIVQIGPIDFKRNAAKLFPVPDPHNFEEPGLRTS